MLVRHGTKLNRHFNLLVSLFYRQNALCRRRKYVCPRNYGLVRSVLVRLNNENVYLLPRQRQVRFSAWSSIDRRRAVSKRRRLLFSQHFSSVSVSDDMPSLF